MAWLPPILNENQTHNIGGRPNTTLETTTPFDPWEDDYHIATAILFPIVIVLLIGNILMFAAVLDMLIYTRTEAPAGPVLILNLAVSDVLIGIASLLSISEAGNRGNDLEVCYAIVGLLAMSVTASCLIMMCIAMARYIAVRKPFRDKRYDARKIAIVVIIIWISSSLIGFAPLMGWRREDAETTFNRCVFLLVVPDSYVIFSFFGVYLSTLTITSYFHIVMCQASRSQCRKIAACEIFGTPSTRRCGSTRNMAKNYTIDESMVVFAVTTDKFIASPSEHQQQQPYTKHLSLPVNTVCNPSSAITFNRRVARASSNIPRVLENIRPMKWSRTVILILGFFVVMWMPFWLTCISQALCKSCDFVDIACSYLMVLGVANSAVNPLVYISTDKKLKEHFCQCFFRATTPIDDEDSSVFLSEDRPEDGR